MSKWRGKNKKNGKKSEARALRSFMDKASDPFVESEVEPPEAAEPSEDFVKECQYFGPYRPALILVDPDSHKLVKVITEATEEEDMELVPALYYGWYAPAWLWVDKESEWPIRLMTDEEKAGR